MEQKWFRASNGMMFDSKIKAMAEDAMAYHPNSNASSYALLIRRMEELERLYPSVFENFNPFNPAVPAQRDLSEQDVQMLMRENGIEEYRPEPSGIPLGGIGIGTVIMDDKKEDVVEKRMNEKKSIFDIIDLD